LTAEAEQATSPLFAGWRGKGAVSTLVALAVVAAVAGAHAGGGSTGAALAAGAQRGAGGVGVYSTSSALLGQEQQQEPSTDNGDVGGWEVAPTQDSEGQPASAMTQVITVEEPEIASSSPAADTAAVGAGETEAAALALAAADPVNMVGLVTFGSFEVKHR
jgi:hypothetical protein